MTDFTDLPDLASRALGGSVVDANDELFAPRENLLTPEPATHAAGVFGPRGQVYDGWETRRRRDVGHDWAVVRLGVAGVVRGVVVDTAWFTGNYPPEISVEATSVEGYPGPDDLSRADWVSLVGRTGCRGDSANAYAVDDSGRWTHLRLSIYPDGGVARFRVHGEVVLDPRFLGGTVDLVAARNGGCLVETSDAFYSSAANIIAPGPARTMGDGWENARRRGGGNDYATFRLAIAGSIRELEIDTTHFVGNAPGEVRLTAADSTAGPIEDPSSWWEILPRSRVQPDTRHRFLVENRATATNVRLDVYPDGGLSRLRCHGEVDPAALVSLRQAFWAAIPPAHRASIRHWSH